MTTGSGSLVRVGLIGCGKIARQVHLRVLAGVPNVAIAGAIGAGVARPHSS